MLDNTFACLYIWEIFTFVTLNRVRIEYQTDSNFLSSCARQRLIMSHFY